MKRLISAVIVFASALSARAATPVTPSYAGAIAFCAAPEENMALKCYARASIGRAPVALCRNITDPLAFYQDDAIPALWTDANTFVWNCGAVPGFYAYCVVFSEVVSSPIFGGIGYGYCVYSPAVSGSSSGAFL